MKILHFKSSVAYSLYINGEYVDYCAECGAIDIIAKCKELTYLYCPVSDDVSYMPISGRVEIYGDGVKASGDVMVVPFGDDHYEIHIMPKSSDISSRYNIVSEADISGCKVRVYNNGYGKVDIAQNTIDIDGVISMASIDEHMGYILVECVCIDDRHIILYDINAGDVIIDTGCDKVEISDSALKVLIDHKDMLCQGTVITYNMATKMKEEYNVYLREVQKERSSEVVPYAFLTALKVGNYALAKEYLSNSFADVSLVQMCNYFGEYSQYYYNAYTLDERINYVLKTMNGYKSYDFVVKEGKIEDITEMALIEKK